MHGGNDIPARIQNIGPLRLNWLTPKRGEISSRTCRLERVCVVQYVLGTGNEQGAPFRNGIRGADTANNEGQVPTDSTITRTNEYSEDRL